MAIAVLFGFGAFPFEPQYITPLGGMLIGNCMNAVSLTGARIRTN